MPDNWHRSAVRADQLAGTTNGADVTVLIVDSGVAEVTNELDRKIKSSYYLDTNGEIQPSDLGTGLWPHGVEWRDHGTSVAAFVCGATHGIAPAAKVVSLCLPAPGSTFAPRYQIPAGRHLLSVKASTLIRVLEFAAREPDVHVVNLSLGVPAETFLGPAQLMLDTCVGEVLDAGRVVIASSGNENEIGAKRQIPGPLSEVPGVVSVGSVDRESRISNFSVSGATPGREAVPTVVAPGEGVCCCLAPTRGGHPHRPRSGTSYAASIVSGVVALLRQKYQEDSPLEIRQRLCDICRPLAGTQANTYGNRMPDASMI